MITAATDGSCLGGGGSGPGGWAWYVHETCFGLSGAPNTTNNIMELTAVRQLLLAIDDDLQIICDSQYVIGCLTKWWQKWQANGWRRGRNQPIENLELIQEILALLEGRNVEFVWQRGHVGHPLNEAADELAGIAAAVQQIKDVE